MGEPIEQEILRECQKKTEILLFQEDSLVKHPYSLSLDLYTSTLTSLTVVGAVSGSGKPRLYDLNKQKLSTIVNDLERIMLKKKSPGTYLDIISMIGHHHTDNSLQAKL